MNKKTIKLSTKETRLIKLYIGLNDKNTKEQLHNDGYYMDIINNTMNKYNITGYTLYNSIGVYQSMREKNIIIETLDINNDINDNTIVNISNELCDTLNQDCILYTVDNNVQNIKHSFIG